MRTFLLPFLALAGPRLADGVALVVLLAFIWWGARKGALRQALSLAVLAAAFAVAGHFAFDAQDTVAKLFALEAGERLAAAWGALLFGGLVVGAILLRLLVHGLAPRSRGGLDRLGGGLLGAAKGAVVLTILGYLAISVGPGAHVPALSRPAGGQPTTVAPPRDLGVRVRGSLSGACLMEWSGVLRKLTWLPPWVERHLDEVDRRLADPSAETHDP